MRAIDSKIDNSAPAQTGRLPAAQFNAISSELQAIVTSASMGIDGAGGPDTDLTMIAQAMARYASGGVYFQDSGASNTYVLTTAGAFVMPKALFNGMRARWYPSATNTGASTANVSGLGSKPLLHFDGSPVGAGDIVANSPIDMEYRPSANSGAGAWIVMPWCYATGQVTNIQNVIAQTALSGRFSLFATPGTYSYTVPAGITQVLAEVLASGGAGGASADGTGSSTSGNAGGGGGAGGLARKLCTVTAGQIIAVTVGAAGAPIANAQGGSGGTASFGAFCSATGGAGGAWGTATLSSTGAGGTGTGGDLNVPGGGGGASADNQTTYNNNIKLYVLNKGGMPPLGFGTVSWTGTGSAGNGYGSGGNGASGGVGVQGGAGASGLVLIRH